VIYPIAHIRSNRRMYVGDAPIAPHLASSLLDVAARLDALPARVERIDAWWWLAAAKDWLASADGIPSMAPFFNIIPFPAAGQNYFRSEVLLTAFADAVVTRGADGETWISGDRERWPLADQLQSALASATDGRIVAFRLYEVVA